MIGFLGNFDFGALSLLTQGATVKSRPAAPPTPIVDEMLTPRRERVPLFAGDVPGRCRCGRTISRNKRFCKEHADQEAAALGLLK